jgi:phosphoglycerate dehydrogenase-like enzyme
MHIFVNIPLDPPRQLRLTTAFPSHHFDFADTSNQSFLAEGPPDPRFAAATVAFGQPPLGQILQSTALRYIQLSTAGYERYTRPDLLAHLKAHNIALCTASSVFAQPCAEHALAMVLAQSRLLPMAIYAKNSPFPWPTTPMRTASRLLKDSHIAIVGYGAIGQILASLLAPFTPHITAFRRSPRGHEPIHTLPYSALDPLLPTFDHLVSILPGGPETTDFFSAPRFAAMKPTAAFYNIGRGTTVHQPSLATALRSSQISAAWLDVTTPEPLPPNHELWHLPNCHITPHTAGGFTAERDTQIDNFITQLTRYTSNQPLQDRIV